MKKWIVIILVAVILSAASFYIYKLLNEVKVGALEGIVSDEAIYYLYSYNLDKKIKDFQSSQFFRQFSTTPIYKKLISPQLDKAKQKAPFISDFIENDLAIAVFSTGNMGASRMDIEDIGSFIILLRLDPQKYSAIKKAVIETSLSFCNKDKISHKQYKGIKITSYKVTKPEMTFSYAFLSDVFMFSNSSDIVQRSIDLAKKDSSNSLLNDKDFQKVSVRVKKDALLWGYQNNKNYYQDLLRRYASVSLKSRPVRGAESLEAFTKMKPFLDMMNVFKGYAFYFDYDILKEGLMFKAFHAVDKKMDETGLLNIFAYDKGVDKNIFNLIPRDTIGYYVGAQSLGDSWNFMKKFYASINEVIKTDMQSRSRKYRYRSAPEMDPGKALQSLESFLGINIEKDLIPILGNNFGFVLAGIEDTEIKPIIPQGATLSSQAPPSFPIILPQVFAFCELKDSAKMDSVMQRLAQNLVDSANKAIKEEEQKRKESFEKFKKSLPQSKSETENQVVQPAQEEKVPITLKEDTYNDIQLHWLDLLNFPLDSFRPNYCILDRYIVLSLSPEVTRKVIDIYKTKRGTFTSNVDFQSIQDKASGDFSNMMFFDLKKLINTFTETRFFKFIDSQLVSNPPPGFSKQDLDSMLEILKNISTSVFSNKLSDSETIESSLYIKIKGLQ